MAIRYGNTTLSAIRYGNTDITQINYLGNTYKLVDSVKITFVEAGVSTTVEYAIGATVNRQTAPSGAAFIGWSTSPSGTNPVKTFTANASGTYYRVVNYNDVTLASKWVPFGTKTLDGPYDVNVALYPQVTLSISGVGTASLRHPNNSTIFLQVNGETQPTATGDMKSPYWYRINAYEEEDGGNGVYVTVTAKGKTNVIG